MRLVQGYSIITEPGKGAVEHDTFTCNHCGKVEFVRAGFGPLKVVVIGWQGEVSTRDADFCQLCYQHICPICAGKGGCTPRMKKIDDEEAAARRLFG